MKTVWEFSIEKMRIIVMNAETEKKARQFIYRTMKSKKKLRLHRMSYIEGNETTTHSFKKRKS